ncbi:uncharacterized protein A4U43_C10F6240 [Asparagus officinalis]|uniref:WAT1-related protein n=1 Tax=Asparagus officinalis TaxID=4686 RepID=A0A5P1E146_ASPOF|nr:uncharacterized protein A4U43_C10F6240 [Asparagus officinalis]
MLQCNIFRVTTFQTLMMLGIEKTNPAIASAMPNIAPGIIFIISASLRFEKVDIGCQYSRAKIMGTVLCLSGAVVMSYLQSPKDSVKDQTQVSLANIEPLKDEANNDWIIGCFYLLAAVLVVSCSTVLQAVTMVHFPAPLSLCSVTSLLGTIFTVFLQIVTEGKVNPGSTTINLQSIITIMILECCVMFSGLYMVLWAKKKEGLVIPNLDDDLAQTSDDVEKPLLNSSKSSSQV